MGGLIFLVLILLWLFFTYKDNTTEYYSDPLDIDDVSPWFKRKCLASCLATFISIFVILSFATVTLGNDFFPSDTVVFAKWFLYFGN